MHMLIDQFTLKQKNLPASSVWNSISKCHVVWTIRETIVLTSQSITCIHMTTQRHTLVGQHCLSHGNFYSVDYQCIHVPT